ncbi:hypothetical protein DFJ73DRAFT_529824 [Zopfochytrium polystomum]|nr:hypothetical protein DFJ73DRAFT_529824 [Zopfochytrium polystomum]
MAITVVAAPAQHQHQHQHQQHAAEPRLVSSSPSSPSSPMVLLLTASPGAIAASSAASTPPSPPPPPPPSAARLSRQLASPTPPPSPLFACPSLASASLFAHASQPAMPAAPSASPIMFISSGGGGGAAFSPAPSPIVTSCSLSLPRSSRLLLLGKPFLKKLSVSPAPSPPPMPPPSLGSTSPAASSLSVACKRHSVVDTTCAQHPDVVAAVRNGVEPSDVEVVAPVPRKLMRLSSRYFADSHRRSSVSSICEIADDTARSESDRAAIAELLSIVWSPSTMPYR